MEDTRLLDKMDDVIQRLTVVETTMQGLSSRIDKYNHVTGRVRDLEHKVENIDTACERLVNDRAELVKRRAVPWGAIVGSVMSGTIVGLIMLVANHIVR